MKRFLKSTLAILMVCVIGLFYGLQYLKMEFADGADYSEMDKREYDFYTPELLKNMPRVSKTYNFHYSNLSGPNAALIYQANFFGITDTRQIDIYLEKNGFKKGGTCNTSENCWISKDPNLTVSVEVEESPDTIRVKMIDKVGY